MRDFDIVIAHRGDAMGLWLTIHSCEIDLARSGFDYRYLICVNGEENSKNSFTTDLGKMNIDTSRVIEFCSGSGKLGHLTVLQESIAPPTARQICTEHSDAKYMFFLDNHCLVSRDYFKRAVMDFEKYDMDMLHSTTKFYEGPIESNLCYEYKLKLDYNFWAEAQPLPQFGYKPYRIAAGGHGGFAVKSDVWREVGGYWKGFNGYAGEEMQVDLSYAMLNKTNYIDPLMIHYHYAGSRGYSRHYTPEYYRNMLMCANIIGGDKWMYKVYESFSTKFIQPLKISMYDILLQAETRSRDYAAEFATRRVRTLDEQLRYFRDNDISC